MIRLCRVVVYGACAAVGFVLAVNVVMELAERRESGRVAPPS